MTSYRCEFSANIVDKNNRNKRNFDRINHQRRFYIVNKIDIVNAVRFVIVWENVVYEHRLERKQHYWWEEHSSTVLTECGGNGMKKTGAIIESDASTSNSETKTRRMSDQLRSIFLRLTDICICQYQLLHRRLHRINPPLIAINISLSLFHEDCPQKWFFSNPIVVVVYKITLYTLWSIEYWSSSYRNA